jgi:F1F0 ATPase subunit 2
MVELFSAFAIGVGAGAIYLLGLWLTVRRIDRLRRRGLWLLLSVGLRLLFLLACFYYLARGGHGGRLLAALIGFMLLRTVVIYCLRPRRSMPRAGREPSS